MLRYLTAGESHGKNLTAILEGMPSGLKLKTEHIDNELKRRQCGYGRGERMRSIEKDRVRITSGVRWGETIGSPIALTIDNKDWPNWNIIMSEKAEDADVKKRLLNARPGHADLAGVLKYDRDDIRDILERASARETAARCAVGAVCKKLLYEMGIQIYSYVVSIGSVKAKIEGASLRELHLEAEKSQVRCPDRSAGKKMMALIDRMRKAGDTLGGVYVVAATGLPVGLGSHVQWDRKLDGRIARAILSIQAHKGVEIGEAFSSAALPGSKVHDEICYSRSRSFFRRTNNAGGIEGGMSNGEPIVVYASVKPIATLLKPLSSVNIGSKKRSRGEIVRSDVCAVESASIVGESAVAFEIADAVREKFGGDSMRELLENYTRYVEYTARR